MKLNNNEKLGQERSTKYIHKSSGGFAGVLVLIIVVVVVLVGILAYVLVTKMSDDSASSVDSSSSSTSAGESSSSDTSGGVGTLKKGMSKEEVESALNLKGECNESSVTGEFCAYKDGTSPSNSTIFASVTFDSDKLTTAKVVEGDKVTQSIE